MKKIQYFLLIPILCGFQNLCFASDTLVVIFNTAGKHQYVSKAVNQCYGLPVVDEKLCTITKSCWYKCPLKDSGKTILWEFVFSYLLVGDSVTLNEGMSSVKALKLQHALQQLYKATSNKRGANAKQLANEIENLQTKCINGNIVLDKTELLQKRFSTITLSEIETKGLLLELSNKIKGDEVFLIDLAQQKKGPHWRAYKVSALHLAPIHGSDLQF